MGRRVALIHPSLSERSDELEVRGEDRSFRRAENRGQRERGKGSVSEDRSDRKTSP